MLLMFGTLHDEAFRKFNLYLTILNLKLQQFFCDADFWGCNLTGRRDWHRMRQRRTVKEAEKDSYRKETAKKE
jgi:hypothetical protein